MSQCVAKTKTGVRCSRIVKDGGNLCFQHKGQPAPKTAPKTQPAPNPQDSYGKKAPKLRKAECLNDNVKYVWVVGKGCFEKLQTPPPPAAKPARPPVIKTVCTERTPIDTREDQFVKNLDCRDLPLEQVRFILGPCVFYEFEIGNRRIYIFGEKHGKVTRDKFDLIAVGANKHNTLSFQAFVHSLAIQNPTKTYDLMFENVYFNNFKKTDTSSSAFNQITLEFLNCIDPKKRPLCRYKNLRTHYIDYRNTDPFDPYRDLSPDNIRGEITNLLKKRGKVLKQINAIKDDKIRSSLVDFFQDFVVSKPEMAGYSRMAVMDVYAIARILRDFDSSKKKGDSPFRGTAQNVIYYAGAYHVETFVRFLTNYLKLKPKVTRGMVGSFNPKTFRFVCQSFVDMGNMTKIGFV
jgi:hypothetical protein